VPRYASGESVISRAVRIFAAFGPDTSVLSVTAIARRAGLPMATTSRMVSELVRHGLLEREPRGQLRVGLRFWELAQRASPTLGLREAAMPFMEDLHSVVGHHVQLGVLDGDEVLFVERLAAPGAVMNYTRIAGRLPLHASSSGLVLLAHASHELQDRVLGSALRRFTPATLDDPHRLRIRLAEIRRDRLAICAGHINEEACGIAVPVDGADGATIAALSVIVPNDSQARTQVPALRAAARGIARTLAAGPDRGRAAAAARRR
jgi:DNA-binding IclR family transcriptional regulator